MNRSVPCLLLVLSLGACAVHPHEGEFAQRPLVLAVAVAPSQATVRAGHSERFQATVFGTGPISQAVSWRLVCRSGCTSDPGEIDTDGLYRAPAENADPLEVEVVARSDAAGVEGRAAVSVPSSLLAVTPAATQVALGGRVRFHWFHDGEQDPPAEWTSQVGSIDAAGNYRAPATFPADPGGGVIAEDLLTVRVGGHPSPVVVPVQLLFAPPFLTIGNWPVAPGEYLLLQGVGLDTGLGEHGVTTVHFPAADGGAIVVEPQATATGLWVQVPPASVSGALHVELRAVDVTPTPPTVQSNDVAFVRRSGLRIHADRTVLSPGESTTLRIATFGRDLGRPISLAADVGSVSDVARTYTAPTTVVAERRAHVRACQQATSTCAGVTITLRPLRLTPDPALLAPGDLLQLGAVAGGAPAAVTWTLAAGGGAVTAEGLYHAAAPPDLGGPVWLLADDGAAAAPLQVGVMGAVPGLLYRRTEPAPSGADPELTAGAPWGAVAEAIAVDGGRAYVLQSPATRHSERWIDVFDVADPLRPAWLGAVEARHGVYGRLLVRQGLLLHLSGWYDPGGAPVEGVDAYDLAWTVPRPTGTAQQRFPTESGSCSARPDTCPASLDGDTVYLLGPGAEARSVELVGFSLSDPTLSTSRAWQLPEPFGQPWILDSGAFVSEGRAYLVSEFGRAVAAYDLATTPARLLGTVPVDRTWPTALSRRHLLVGDTCLDLTPGLQVAIPCTSEPAEAEALASAWPRLVLPGLHLDDYTDPAAPRRVATVLGGSLPGALLGDLYFSPEATAGLAIYDLGPAGGPRPRGSATVTVGPHFARSTVVRGDTLYAAYDWLSAWDLAVAPPALRSTTQLPGPVTALATAGDLLLVGTSGTLQVWSIVDPAAPLSMGAFGIEVAALAASGSTAWVGTPSGELVAVALDLPTAPMELGRLALGAPVRAIQHLEPGRLVVALATADGTGGDLLVVDGTIPVAPAVLGAAGLAAPVLDAAVAGSLAAVVTDRELLTVDLSDPSRPLPLASVPTPSVALLAGVIDPPGPTSPTRIFWSGGLAWVAAQGEFPEVDWLGAFELTSPRWPRLVSSSRLPGAGRRDRGLTVVGERAFLFSEVRVGETSSGPGELDLSRPRNVVLELPASPPVQRSAP